MEPVFLSTAVKIFLVLVYSLILLLAFILANRRGRLLVAWLFVVLTLILPPSLVVENEGLALNAIYQYFQVQARPGSPFPWWADFLAISFFYLPVFVLSFGLVVGTCSSPLGCSSSLKMRGINLVIPHLLAKPAPGKAVLHWTAWS